MPTQTINISLPKELVQEIDTAAKSEYASRSDYIRQALVGQLSRRREKTWDLLEDLLEEGYQKAEVLGLTTDEDFVRITKEVRRDLYEKNLVGN